MTASRQFSWLFGDLFDKRLEFETENRDVRWSTLIRNFRSSPQLQETWAGHIALYRASLVNPDKAPPKVAADIPVTSPDFDGKLFDALSECQACSKLKPLGFSNYEVLIPPVGEQSLRTPDFLALHKGEPAAIEVKNLRAHECVEDVMPDLFYDEKLKGLHLDNIRLVEGRPFRGRLNSREKEKLREIVLHLTGYPLKQLCHERPQTVPRSFLRLCLVKAQPCAQIAFVLATLTMKSRRTLGF